MLVHRPVPASLVGRADLSVPLAARGKKSRVRGRNRFVARLGLVSDSMIPYCLQPSRRARTGLLGHAQRTHSPASRVTFAQLDFGPTWLGDGRFGRVSPSDHFSCHLGREGLLSRDRLWLASGGRVLSALDLDRFVWDHRVLAAGRL